MPFLKGGRLAITRTKNYLQAGQILLNDTVKVIAIHHTPGQTISKGCDELIQWFLPPLQFKNPNVQIITLKNMCPTPFVQVFTKTQGETLIDCSFRSGQAVHEHLKALFGKDNSQLSVPNPSQDDILPKENPANFGRQYPRQCICEVYGQVPCSSHIGRADPWPGCEPKLPPIDGLTDTCLVDDHTHKL